MSIALWRDTCGCSLGYAMNAAVSSSIARPARVPKQLDVRSSPQAGPGVLHWLVEEDDESSGATGIGEVGFTHHGGLLRCGRRRAHVGCRRNGVLEFIALCVPSWDVA